MFNGFKKIIFSFTTLGLVMISLVGIFSPAPAQAQLPVSVTLDVPRGLSEIGSLVSEGLKGLAISAIMRTVDYTVRRVAYDSAVWLASGGKGQTPFAHTTNFGDYMKNTVFDAAASSIEALSKGEFDICKIPDVKIDLAMKIGLRTNFLSGGGYGAPSKPKCTLEEFKNNWTNENWKSKYGADQIGKRFNATLSKDNSGLGTYGQITEKINNKIITEKAAAQLKRQEGEGFKGKETVGGQVQTPPALVKEEFKALTPSQKQAEDKKQLDAAFASGNVKVIPAALTLFLNTLVGTMVKNWQENGMLPFGACIGGYGGDICNQGVAGDISKSYYSLNGGGVAYAQSFFNYIKTIEIKPPPSYEILAELANCPDAPNIYNCRADDDLILALRQADTNRPVTIAQALEKGWLHGDWKFIPYSDENGANSDKECFQKAYCYGNAQVLRQLRIMPLGFEIAAKNSSQDKPWTLRDVVNGFNNCSLDAQGNVVSDPTKPFCHLIDPNWVLRVPPTKCNASVYGPNLITSGAPDRLQECVDLQSCVSYDTNGRCNDYAYCTREKNTWSFDAQKCEQQYATCRSFTNANGQNVAYLQRTLDGQSCTQENVGCRGYSLTQKNGAWVAPSINSDGTNSGIFFNNKISTSCSANSAGCSAFQVVKDPNETSEMLYLKKAPDYLKCYDAKTSTIAVDWPVTQSDLIKIEPAAECSNYSGVCVADEVNCNFYTPQSGGGTQIPGRFTKAEVTNGQITWNDQCDAKCVGYAAFREMPSNYSNGQSVAYIIPSSGQKCTAQEEGCSAFTNLSAGTGDQVEHYSYLRPCVKPGPSVQSKTYVTYEGAVQGGYQLKTYTLVVNNDTANGPIGAPKYFYKTIAELGQHNLDCTEDTYKNGIAPLDCRQFNDEAGNIYYRLLSQTIPVTEACTAYRLDNAELAAPGVCFQNGEYRGDGSCFYEGLPGTISNNAGNSRSCSAAADTCRGYKGNAGNNIQEVFYDNFENVSTDDGWSDGVISAESTRVGEHSYANIVANPVNTEAQPIVRTVSAQAQQSYDLSFWAKGSNSMQVTFGEQNGDGSDVGYVSLSDTWNYYHLGPFEYTGSSTATLKFINRDTSGAGRIFLDNVRLVGVRELQYLVKKSLSVDPICDSNQNDNLPGEALGCEAYRDPTNRTFSLTGFSYLCRENAIGCTAVTQTFNTPDEAGPRAYNVRLTGAGGSTQQVTLGADTYSCVIPVGDTACYVNMVGHSESEIRKGVPDRFITSTIYVPADSPVSAPIYLVANKAGTCNGVDLGCTIAGAQQLTPGGLKFVTTTIKNDPALYDTALCRSEAVGCNAYSDGADTQYFKDPAITGQKVCTYRTNVRFNGQDRSGWFWKGVGKCENTNDSAPGYCTSDSDCGASRCINIGDQPCYLNYQNSGEYGLWSSGNTSTYRNFVGECPVNQNKCSEFLDPNDNNQAYYFIKDNRISEGDCSGQVSQKFGCALFNETSNPNKFFNSNRLYKQSNDENGKKVPATQSALPDNDANLIIKVGLDRVCGEWLGCKNRSVFDEATGKYKDVCYNVSLCNGETCANVKSDYSRNILSENIYKSRKVGWEGQDFSGYSILDLYPLSELEDHNFSTAAKPDYRLVYKVKNAKCEVEGSTCVNKHNEQGICKNNACVRSIGGMADSVQVSGAEPQTCRGYPEKDAPFPFTNYIAYKNADYSLAKKCSENANPSSNEHACECDYTKVSYGDTLDKYWRLEKPNQTDGVVSANASLGVNGKYFGVPPGICVGGTNGIKGQEKACLKTADCLDGGTCQQKSGTNELIGYRGYCVEEDSRSTKYGDPTDHTCLTWFPGRTNGLMDLYNQNAKAGYILPSGYDAGPYYCTEKEIWRKPIGQKSGSDFYYDCGGDAKTMKFDGGVDQLINDALQTLVGPTMSFGNAINKIKNAKIKDDDGGECTDYGSLPRAMTPSGNNMYLMDLKASDEDYSPCPDGTETGAITYAGYNAIDNLIDDEDQISLSYTCYKPNEYWLPETSEPIKNNQAAESIDGVQIIEREYRCKIMYKITDRPSEVKAATQNIWKSETLNQITQFANADCDPFGAVGLNRAVLPGDIIVMKSPEEIYNTDLGISLKNNNLLTADFKCLLGVAIPRGISNVFKGEVVHDGSLPAAGTPQTAGTLQNLFGSGMFENNTVQGGYTPAETLIHTETLQKLFARSVAKYVLTGPTFPQPVPDTKQCRVVEGGLFSDYFDVEKNGDPCGEPSVCLKTGAGSTSGDERLNQSNPCAEDQLENLSTEHKAFCNYVCSPDMTGSYTPENYMQQTGIGWDVTAGTAGTNPKAPIVRALGTCRIVGGVEVCREGDEGLTLVTNEASFSSGKVRLTFENSVAMRFFAFADTNHMPIRRVAIDWGDGDEDTYTASGDNFDSGSDGLSAYRNQRGGLAGTCVTTRTDPSVEKRCVITNVFHNNPAEKIITDRDCRAESDCAYTNVCQEEQNSPYFGTILNKTCNKGYFEFKDHSYVCEKQDNDTDIYKKDCPEGGTTVFPNGCCVYKPRVHVKDNWGWCTGTEDCDPSIGKGCYDNGGETRSTDYCDIINNDNIKQKAWVNYSGSVYVAPE